ncbi:protelomerase family protein [Floridanema aerugineum]|uniref:Protelomerase family protein n=1 Tax=Floridaenema aerugineum BLCC-F46 TaxID=3153654 RepID=A0ABV4X6Y3_9CYAN
MRRSPQSQLRDEQFFKPFLDEVGQLKSESAIEALCKEWLPKIQEYCTQLSKKVDDSGNKVLSVNTYNDKLSNFRNMILAWQKGISLTKDNSYKPEGKDKSKAYNGKIHYAWKYLKEGLEFYRERTEKTLQKSENRLQESEAITLEIVEQYIATATKLIASYDWREVVAGIIALTGRRFGEGMKTAKFEPTSLYKVRFTGQLKHGVEDYEMFSLIESHIVAKELDRLRNMPEIKALKAEDIEQITNDKNSTVNNCVKEHFGSFVPVLSDDKGTGNLSTRSLRYIYAAIAAYWFKPARKETLTFYKEQLGHISKTAAFSYVAYQVCDNEGLPFHSGVNIKMLETAPTTIEKKEIRYRMTEEQKQKLDQLQSEWGLETQAEVMEQVLKYVELGMRKAPVAEEKAPVAEEETPATKPTDNTQDIDLESVSLEDLNNKYKTHPGSAEERMRRAVQAIMDYNDYVATEQQQRWRVTTSILAQLSGSRSDRIKDFFNKHETWINDHNEKYNFSAYHNKGKGDITEVIKVK